MSPQGFLRLTPTKNINSQRNVFWEIKQVRKLKTTKI